MPGTDITALSDTFRIAEYDTYFKSHAPYAKPPSHEHEGRLLDRHASVVTDRWVYPLVCLYQSGGNFHVPFEARVDENGVVLRGMPSSDPSLIIAKRPTEFLYNSDAPFGLEFPKLDREGRALMVRLFLSPYRLSRAAVRVLCGTAFQQGARKHIPSLWSWKDDPVSAIKSAEGYYLDEHENWLTVDGRAERVWVGSDPFHIAERRSAHFVEARKAYIDRFEPRDEAKTDDWWKEQLLLALNDSIASNHRVDGKYRGALDEGRITKEIREYEDERLTLLADLNRAADDLVSALKNPYFAALQYGSLDEECYNPDFDHSEALAAHIKTLTHVLRLLDECCQGIDLISHWIREAQSNELHFINHIVFPSQPIRAHIFKTARWMSKSTVGLLTALFPTIVAALKPTAKEIAERLHLLGVFESRATALSCLTNKTSHITDIVAGFGLTTGSRSVTYRAFLDKTADQVSEFVKADRSGVIDVPSFPRTKLWKNRIFVLVDAINLALSFRAVLDAKGEQAIKKAAMGSAATLGFLGAALAEMAPGTTHRRVRIIAGVRGVCSLLYAALDFADAVDADAKGDHDRKLALIAAGTAELCMASIYLYAMLAGVPAVGIPMAIAGVIAAAGYTAATWLKDDPLEKFLTNCEYGKTPYGEAYEPKWARPVHSWPGDYPYQREVLTRVLARFTLWWKRVTPQLTLGANIDCAIRPSDARIEVIFTAQYHDREDATEKLVFEGSTLPRDGSKPLRVEPSTNHLNEHGIRNLIVSATLTMRRSGYRETYSGLLIDEGKSKDHGRFGLVE